MDSTDPPPSKIVPRPATFPVRRPGETVYVTVPVEWPESMAHAGKTFYLTGKVGHRAGDKAQAAEYEAVDEEGRKTGERVWLLADGTVTEE